MIELWLALFFSLVLIARLLALVKSVKNEAALKKQGAKEHGRGISNALVLAFIGILAGSVVESLVRLVPIDLLSFIFLGVWIFSIAILVLVVKNLGDLWTFKVLIAPNHTLITKPLFKAFRHPNYYLNLLPEIAAITLFGHAYLTFAVGFPLYFILILLRVRIEEKVMKEKFSDY